MGYSKQGRFSSDTETVFATDQAETYLDQRIERETFKIDPFQRLLEDMTVTTRLHEENKLVYGSHYGSKITGPKFLLEGLANADALNAAATYTYPQCNMAELMRRGLGGSVGAAGSATVAGCTASLINVTGGQGSRFTEGSVFGVDVTGTGIIEVRRVVDVTVDAIIPHMAFSAGPASGRTVYNSECFFLDEDGVGGDTNTLVLRWLGALSGDQWIARGGAVSSMTFEMALNSLLKVAMDFVVATTSKTTGETFAGATYDGGGGLPVRVAEVQYGTAQTTPVAATRKILSAEAFSVNPGVAIDTEGSVDGIETVKRWRQLPFDTTAQLTTRAFQDYDTFYTDFLAKTEKSIGIQIGNTTGSGGTGIVYFHLPRVQFSKSPDRNEGGGFVKTTVDFKGMEDKATGLTTDVGCSKFYVAFL